jgi:hypothetical protein
VLGARTPNLARHPNASVILPLLRTPWTQRPEVSPRLSHLGWGDVEPGQGLCADTCGAKTWAEHRGAHSQESSFSNLADMGFVFRVELDFRHRLTFGGIEGW